MRLTLKLASCWIRCWLKPRTSAPSAHATKQPTCNASKQRATLRWSRKCKATSWNRGVSANRWECFSSECVTQFVTGSMLAPSSRPARVAPYAAFLLEVVTRSVSHSFSKKIFPFLTRPRGRSPIFEVGHPVIKSAGVPDLVSIQSLQEATP